MTEGGLFVGRGIGVTILILFRLYRAALRKKGIQKSFVEIVVIAEVFLRIGVLLAEHSFLDEFEDHVADVSTRVHSPLPKEGFRHGAEFLEGEIAKSEDEFFATDMAFFTTFLPGTFERKVQRVFQEKVRAPFKSLFAFENVIDSSIEAQRLHGSEGRKIGGVAKSKTSRSQTQGHPMNGIVNFFEHCIRVVKAAWDVVPDPHANGVLGTE